MEVRGREINFLAGQAGQVAKWFPNELMIALPFRDFEAVIESIPKSGLGTAPTPLHPSCTKSRVENLSIKNILLCVAVGAV